MPRPSPLALRRAPMPEWTLTALTDPAQPDWTPVDWTLRRLDPLAQSEVGASAAAFLEDYEEAGALPTLAGDALPVTGDAAKTAAAVHAMQVRLRVTGEDADLDLFSIEEVYAMMATLPDAWQRVEIVSAVLAKFPIGPELRHLVEREGPDFVALATRLGCFQEPDPGNSPRQSAPATSP